MHARSRSCRQSVTVKWLRILSLNHQWLCTTSWFVGVFQVSNHYHSWTLPDLVCFRFPSFWGFNHFSMVLVSRYGWERKQRTHLFLLASRLPIPSSLVTASPLCTLPIARRFILEGLGNFSTHSGTVDPDCSITFAILSPWESSKHTPTERPKRELTVSERVRPH